MNIREFSLVARLAVIVSVALSGQAQAAIEEVVVTVRRTAESLQDIPVAVSAFSENDMADRAMRNLEDIAAYTPGFTFESFSSGVTGTPVIRGLALTDITSPLPNVSVFIDGVYVQRPYAIDVGLFDLQRVEVVKGPQSALYGRNAFAGAINYVTKKPTGEFAASAELTSGSDERQDLKFRADVPVLGDRAAVSLSYFASQFDGTHRNNYPLTAGAPNDLAVIGGWDNESFGVQFSSELTETTSIDFAYYRSSRLSEPAANYYVNSADNGVSLPCGPNGASRAICGEVSYDPLDYASTASTRLPGVVLDPEAQFTDTDTDFMRADLRWDISAASSLVYQFGAIDVEALSITGGDWDPLNPSVFALGGRRNFGKGPAGRNDTSSHELRYEYSGSRYELLAGAYYSETDDRAVGENILAALGVPLSGLLIGDATTPANLPIFNIGVPGPAQRFPLENSFNKDRSWAAFLAGTVNLLEERLRVRAEVRYTDETRRTQFLVTGAGPGGFVEVPADRSSTYSFITPRFSVDYRIADEHLLYASVAKGIKAGGFNQSASLPSEQTFGEEVNWTYETGLKSTYLEGTLQLNSALYYIDWRDMATKRAATPVAGSPLSGSITEIIGSAVSKGLELDLAWQATDALSLNAGLSLNDPTYDQGVITNRGRAICDDIICPISGAIGGNTIARASEVQGLVGGQWDGEWADSGIEYFVRGDVSYQSKQYVEELNLATIEARTLVNGSAGFSRDNWSARFWVKNLLDTEYVANSFFINLGSNTTYIPSLGARRTWGVTLSYTFGGSAQ